MDMGLGMRGRHSHWYSIFRQYLVERLIVDAKIQGKRVDIVYFML